MGSHVAPRPMAQQSFASQLSISWGGGVRGGGLTPPPPFGPPQPPLSDWANFSLGLRPIKIFSGAFGASQFRPKISSAPLAPLTTQRLLRGGWVAPTAPPTHPSWTPSPLSKTLGPRDAVHRWVTLRDAPPPPPPGPVLHYPRQVCWWPPSEFHSLGKAFVWSIAAVRVVGRPRV